MTHDDRIIAKYLTVYLMSVIRHQKKKQRDSTSTTIDEQLHLAIHKKLEIQYTTQTTPPLNQPQSTQSPSKQLPIELMSYMDYFSVHFSS